MLTAPKSLLSFGMQLAFCCWLVFLTSLALAHDDLHEQIARATQQIRKDPRNPELYLKRGELHRAHRDWTKALADYNRAARLAPTLAKVNFHRGRMLLEAGRLWPAKTALDHFLGRETRHGEAFLTRARVLQQLGEHRRAANDYTRALALLSGAKPDYYLERAKAQFAVNGAESIDEALGGLDEGIVKFGPLVTLQLFAIDLELGKKNWDGALERLDRVAAQSPRKEMWLARRGQILMQAGRAHEAREAFAAALKAIEALPARTRQIRATAKLEKRVRSALESQLPDGTEK